MPEQPPEVGELVEVRTRRLARHPTDCEILLDYEIDEEERGNKKKLWRHRWPDDVRDEILARLPEVKAERAREEVRSGVGKRGRVPPG